MAPKLATEIIYIEPGEVFQQTVQLELGATIEQALEDSDLFQRFPGLQALPLAVGIYGKQVGLGYVLQQDDRIEVYRPLIFDPKEARRNRAKKRDE